MILFFEKMFDSISSYFGFRKREKFVLVISKVIVRKEHTNFNQLGYISYTEPKIELDAVILYGKDKAYYRHQVAIAKRLLQEKYDNKREKDGAIYYQYKSQIVFVDTANRIRIRDKTEILPQYRQVVLPFLRIDKRNKKKVIKEIEAKLSYFDSLY